MSATLSGECSYGLYLGSPSLVGAAQRAVVARYLDLDPNSLHLCLASPQTPARQGLSHSDATRLRTLLQALGWPASIRPDTDQPDTDLSLQPAIWADHARLVQRLARMLDMDAGTVRDGLLGPGGLVLPAASPQRRLMSPTKLRHLRGLIHLSSDPLTARYDIFPARPLAKEQRAAILRQLRPFAASASALTGALAEGLPAILRDRAMAQLSPKDVIAVDRAFQRFELHLIGVSGWTNSELADFLSLRTGQPRARFEVISPAEPVVLDTALTHGVARQFCADYAAIGLFTRLHLRGLPQDIENPIR